MSWGRHPQQLSYWNSLAFRAGVSVNSVPRLDLLLSKARLVSCVPLLSVERLRTYRSRHFLLWGLGSLDRSHLDLWSITFPYLPLSCRCWRRKSRYIFPLASAAYALLLSVECFSILYSDRARKVFSAPKFKQVPILGLSVITSSRFARDLRTFPSILKASLKGESLPTSYSYMSHFLPLLYSRAK